MKFEYDENEELAESKRTLGIILEETYRMGFNRGVTFTESCHSKAETEPKHGRWISKSGSIYLYCSDCGREKIIDSDDWNYCPNCGADMREVRNELDYTDRCNE